MNITLLCPSCNESLVVTFENDKITSIVVNNSIETCQAEIANLLKKHCIEFG